MLVIGQKEAHAIKLAGELEADSVRLELKTERYGGRMPL